MPRAGSPRRAANAADEVTGAAANVEDHVAGGAADAEELVASGSAFATERYTGDAARPRALAGGDRDIRRTGCEARLPGARVDGGGAVDGLPAVVRGETKVGTARAEVETARARGRKKVETAVAHGLK